MKKCLNFLFSNELMSFLFLFFGLSMGIATFIENDYNTQTAKVLVFDSWWFQLILFIFVINFIGNIKKYRLFQRKMFAVLLLHFSFIIIIIGAGITKYISYETTMPIKEGETTSSMLSEKMYLTVSINDRELEKTIEKSLLFAHNSQNDKGFIATAAHFMNVLRGGNKFTIIDDFKNKPFTISYLNYLPNAEGNFLENKDRIPHLHLVESSRGVRTDHYLKPTDKLSFKETDLSFEKEIRGGINIYRKDSLLYIKSHRPLTYLTMTDRLSGEIMAETETELKIRTLYTIGSLQFVIPEPILNGELIYTSGEPNEFPEDMLIVEIAYNGKQKAVNLFGTKSKRTAPTIVTLDDLNFNLHYGAKIIKLPFAIKLNDFELEHYPGSNSPKSFASKITVHDTDNSFDYKISMNNVLDYKGFRFFQASYDDSGPVEETYLSVNHDKIGTWTTYVGYVLLFIGLIMLLFSAKTNFGRKRKQLRKLKSEAVLVSVLLLGCLVGAKGQSVSGESLDILSFTKNIPNRHAEEFGHVVIQDFGGRMKPVDTFGSELLRKINKKDHFQGLTSNQVILSIFSQPKLWEEVPMIYMKEENLEVRELLGIPHDEKYARLSDFFTSDNRYKLIDEVDKAVKKKIKSEYEKSILNINGRVNLLYLAIQGDLFAILPLENDVNNKWTFLGAVEAGTHQSTSLLEMANQLSKYKHSLIEAQESQNYELPSSFISELVSFQKNYGKQVIPSPKKIELEIFYNKYDIFRNLFWQYMLASLFLFITVIIQIFKNKSKFVNLLVKIGISITAFLFMCHAAGLGIRWYISGHAPWSNGYESMIYVSWATLLFGLVLGRKSGLTVAATTFVSAIVLMVAHWNWMDPSIGNLVPVLDSYWLMVHVAIIVAAYGPFAVGMILGMVNLLLFSIQTKSKGNRIKELITELTIINDMALTIGLILLSIGTFLGGIWANESWGRYWGWDPKETWALISIMVYAFVLHMRLVPKLQGALLFNITSVFAFSSILMTYLGVNHLLSGLHSYAAGESAPIPNEIWAWVVIAILLSLIATIRQKQIKTY